MEYSIVGDHGPVVLLLPGGGESVDGYFPGLAEGLTADPGCRVVHFDRPGTGSNTTAGTLAGASDAVHALVQRLETPVVVIGHSLGGAVAALLARDHPDDVAGVVLLDPSPVNDVAAARALKLTAGAAAGITQLPVVGGFFESQFRTQTRKMADKHNLRPDVRPAFFKSADVDLVGLRDAAAGLDTLAASFRESDLPRGIPAAVVTADRSDRSRMRKAHARLADALDAPLIEWPNAIHAVHLTHPDEVLDVCRKVVGQIGY